MEVIQLAKYVVKHFGSHDEALGFVVRVLRGEHHSKDIELPLRKENKAIQLYELIGIIHQLKKESQQISRTTERRHHGIYYTSYSIARKICDDLLDQSDGDIMSLSFLEPCCGIGIFIIAYLDSALTRVGTTPSNVQKLINNIFFADLDDEAIAILREAVPAYIMKVYSIQIKLRNKNSYVGSALFDIDDGRIKKVSLAEKFNKAQGFDVVATNPPYRLLKANSNHYERGHAHKDEVGLLVEYIRENKIYKYNSGTLNLYKLFVEEIFENYTSDSGLIGLLIPQTLLNDLQSARLRRRILETSQLSTIYVMPEKNTYFPDITQSFCFFAAKKGQASESLKLVSGVVSDLDMDKEPILIDIEHLREVSSELPVIWLDALGWDILRKLVAHPKVKEIPELVNLRGELDLTLDSIHITEEDTGYKLLRGNNISLFRFLEPDRAVSPSFVASTAKAKYIKRERIACQQISNINSSQRLKCALTPKGYVLGNSCNFIAIDNDSLFSSSSISLKYLLGVLNSAILNWRFCLTSSNNHVGNHEINDLPIPIPTEAQKIKVEQLVDELMTKNGDTTLDKLNRTISELFGLTEFELEYISPQKAKRQEVLF